MINNSNGSDVKSLTVLSAFVLIVINEMFSWIFKKFSKWSKKKTTSEYNIELIVRIAIA